MANRVLAVWMEDAKLKNKLKSSFHGYNVEEVVHFSSESKQASIPLPSPENVSCLTKSCVTDVNFRDNKSFASTSLLLPGGLGVRQTILVDDCMRELQQICTSCDRIFSVCTGSALLAQANVLEHKNATTNKMAYDYVIQFGKNVKWKKSARWVCDGNVWTSSGVSAGMDMALKIIEQDSGSVEFARAVGTFVTEC